MDWNYRITMNVPSWALLFLSLIILNVPYSNAHGIMVYIAQMLLCAMYYFAKDLVFDRYRKYSTMRTVSTEHLHVEIAHMFLYGLNCVLFVVSILYLPRTWSACIGSFLLLAILPLCQGRYAHRVVHSERKLETPRVVIPEGFCAFADFT